MLLELSPEQFQSIRADRMSSKKSIVASSKNWTQETKLCLTARAFAHLGIVFHESGGMTEALARLLQNGKGAAARLSAKHKALMCDV